jgi:hypothetical protein
MIALITMHELQGLTVQQLGELHQHLLALLANTDPDSADLRNILATLENIERSMGYVARPKPRGFTMQP